MEKSLSLFITLDGYVTFFFNLNFLLFFNSSALISNYKNLSAIGIMLYGCVIKENVGGEVTYG